MIAIFTALPMVLHYYPTPTSSTLVTYVPLP